MEYFVLKAPKELKDYLGVMIETLSEGGYIHCHKDLLDWMEHEFGRDLPERLFLTPVLSGDHVIQPKEESELLTVKNRLDTVLELGCFSIW